MLEWYVKEYDFNRSEFYDENILKYRIDYIKKLKKKCQTKEEFSKEIRSEMMYHYWSKCEHEMIIKKDNYNNIWLEPWIGDKNVKLDVTNDETFDWKGFMEKYADRYWNKCEAKIDVFDQLEYRWDEFIDYIWNTRLPYERKKSYE